MIDRFKENFREEAKELLEHLESDLMLLESSPDDPEIVGAVFRAIHTIKGSSAMFGFDSVSRFAHDVEMTLDRLREGAFEVTKAFVDVILECRDHILMMIRDDIESSPEVDETSRSLADKLTGVTSRAAVNQQIPVEPELLSIHIKFTPPSRIFLQGSKPLLLINELAELGDLSVTAHPSDSLNDIESMDPELCHSSWDIFLTTSKSRNAVDDVFIFVEDDADLVIEELESGSLDDEPTMRLGEILVKQGAVEPETIEKSLNEQKNLGTILVDKKALTQDELATALEAQKHLQQVKDKQTDASAGTNVKIDSSKLDDLIDLVGELVTVQARLSRSSHEIRDEELRNVSEIFERLVIDLRETAMSIRMLPIGTTFNRYKRLVRDLSGELGKQIDLVTRGGETELDKTVLDKLNNPLVHLIRNSIDHGIESPESLLATVTLSLKHIPCH